MALGAASHGPTLRRSGQGWSSYSLPGQGHSSAATLTTEQPSSGTALLPPHGEGSRKGDLKKNLPHLHPVSIPQLTGHLPRGRNTRETRKTNSKSSRRKSTLCVGAWNIRTLMDNQNCDRPERRTALVGRELLRYSIDIAALSETRLADTGEITEAGAGYTFFWSGKALNERREAGVGFAIRTTLVKNLGSLPRGISDRLMVMRIPLHGKTHLSLISVYAPTMTYTLEEKELFYQNLSKVLRSVPKDDKLLILGDFNARVGRDAQSWPDVIGPHGIGHENTNGQLLLTLCAEHGLTITNTLFQLPDIHKTTWMHPRSKHWHLIDYVIIRRRDIQDVRITRAMRGADCWTDHLLLRCKLSFSIASRHRRQKSDVKKKMDVQKLNEPNTKEALITNLANQLEHLPAEEDYEKAWANFRDVVYDSASLTLGYMTRKHQDWFDNNKEITTLLQEKKEAFTAWLNDKDSQAKRDRLKNIRGKVQTELRQMKDKWWENKAAELQQYADEHNSKKFFASLKDVYGSTPNAMAPVRSANGTLLTEKSNIIQRWSEHFSQLLNRPSQIDQQAIQDMPQRSKP
ncbi:craniofacial development protein 2-like [Diadema setosum]|uniref:craniofacial development protein 2-like n=1 Tax=Diadema setosum TaxID=31175 RepID=UPI003B3B0886